MDRVRSRVAIATCSEVAGKVQEDLQLIEALRRRSIEAAHLVWNDPEVDWLSFALVVIRSTWDYPERLKEFLCWASRIRMVLNPLPILQWNTDKRYLIALANAGLPVIPTRFLGPADRFELPTPPFVVKPAVSCGARDTMRFNAGDAALARQHVRNLQANGRVVMVQPYLPGIESKGELALMFIGGAYTHSICRGALLIDGKPANQGLLGPQQVQAHEPSQIELSLGERVLLQVPGGPSQLLYARVDLVPGPTGEPMILEVELTEPSLFLEFSGAGVERLADCIASALA